MTVQEIVTRVRAAIDELTANDSQFLSASSDEVNLDKVIVDKISYALQHIIENAPLEKLDDSMLSTLTSTELQAQFSIDTDTLVGKLQLPADMLRIVEARLSSWSLFPIPEPDTSPVYLMQQDTYARGSWDRPVNILTYTAGHQVLEMYCAKTASEELVFVYVKKPSGSYSVSNPTQTVDVPAKLEAALIYQVAGLSMVAFREDVAASLFAIAARHMGIKPENEETA